MCNVLAVFVGGVVGTALRFALTAFVPQSAHVATLVINVAGAFVLGVLVSSLWAKPSTPLWLKAGLGTGLLGGFTTFSAIAVDLAAVLPSIGTESTGWAFGMIGFFIVEILLGIVAAWGGLALGARRAASAGSVGSARGAGKSHGARGPSSAATHSVITDDGGDL